MATQLRIALLSALAVCAAPLAMAAPGGGGGSMGGGSSSAPAGREDPQAAYQAGVAALNAQNYREAIHQFR